MIPSVFLSSALLACHAPSEVVVLEGFQFDWAGFNHRFSHLRIEPGLEGSRVSVIGGTSTTAAFPELPDGCDRETCNEFPFKDSAEVVVNRAVAKGRQLRWGATSAELIVDGESVSDTVTVELNRPLRGEAVAVLQGITLDSAVPLDDTSLTASSLEAISWVRISVD